MNSLLFYMISVSEVRNISDFLTKLRIGQFVILNTIVCRCTSYYFFFYF